MQTKVHLVKAMVFPVVMYRCEHWTIKESWVPKNWCFLTVVLEKTLESPWTAGRSSQSILKEISPEYALEGLMLKLKLQYPGQLMHRTDSLEKTLMLGKIEGRRRRGWQRWDGWMASPTQWTWVWVDSGNWWWTGRPGLLQSMGLQRVGHDWASELTDRINCIAQGNYTQYLSITYNGKESEKRIRYICMYNWITLLYSWNIINQL